ncbi:hypothetical protein IW262DRAFT_1408271 [Armillaria fumosa]|nr:hypothetical protein IW262DRAFT_1408271 [Armillaria fumosa]
MRCSDETLMLCICLLTSTCNLPGKIMCKVSDVLFAQTYLEVVCIPEGGSCRIYITSLHSWPVTHTHSIRAGVYNLLSVVFFSFLSVFCHARLT